MQDMVGDTVQQIALVAHHDEACPIGFEEGEHGRGPYSAAAARAQAIFCLPIRPVSAVVNAATRKPARLRQKNKIKRDAFTPRPHANDQQGDDQ
jgi:hypothetical protein